MQQLEIEISDDDEEYISPAIDDNTPDEDEVSSAELDSDGVRMKMKAGFLFHTRSTTKIHRGDYITLSGMIWRTETPAQSKPSVHNTKICIRSFKGYRNCYSQMCLGFIYLTEYFG